MYAAFVRFNDTWAVVYYHCEHALLNKISIRIIFGENASRFNVRTRHTSRFNELAPLI